MNRLKVTTVVGTRPEIIRLSRVLSVLDENTDHQLVHTGQNYDYELSEIFFQDLGIRAPDVYLEAAGESAAVTIGQLIAKTDAVLAARRPDALLVLGDTNSCLAAIAAKRRRIPVFHMEAGNRCFDERVPEEINRRIIDHIADINLPYSGIARQYLLREGIPPDRVIRTGSPMAEVLEFYHDRIGASGIVRELGLERQSYFLVSAHREENVDPVPQFQKLIDLLNDLARTFALPVIVSTHPRMRKRLDESGLATDALIRFLKPLAFTDYVHLQMHARTTLSDSGTISEESSILNFPALNIREAYERPEAMEEAAVMLTGLSADRIRQALAILEKQPRGEKRLLDEVEDYRSTNVSAKILRIILSHTDYVRRTVWHESI